MDIISVEGDGKETKGQQPVIPNSETFDADPYCSYCSTTCADRTCAMSGSRPASRRALRWRKNRNYMVRPLCFHPWEEEVGRRGVLWAG